MFPVLAAQLQPGAIDPDFLPNNGVRASYAPLAVQTDNRIIVWKTDEPNPAPYTTNTVHLARLNPDGSVDASFNAHVRATNGGFARVKAATVQPDGRILIMGAFSEVNGTRMPSVARFNVNGTLDATFQPEIEPPTLAGIESSKPSGIEVMALAPDGRIYLGATFGDQTQILRLWPDGTLDSQFKDGIHQTGQDYRLDKILILPDGKLLLAGVDFLPLAVGDPTSPGTYGVGILRRLTPDGRLDQSFLWEEVGRTISDFDVQTNGSIVAVLISGLSRYTPDGAVDKSFTPLLLPPHPVAAHLSAVKVDPDQRILLAGWFSRSFGYPGSGVARLLKNGDLDASFNAGSRILMADSLLLQPDGKLLVYGTIDQRSFTIARLIGGEREYMPPVLTSAPEPLTIETGNNAFLTAGVSGYPLRFQWSKDGKILPGATDGFLYLENVGKEGEGEYSVQVNNHLGMVTSPSARLTVVPSPTGANLLANPSFEQASMGAPWDDPETVSRPVAFFGWTTAVYPEAPYWQWQPSLFIPPSSLPGPFGENQYPAQGTNFVGIYSGSWDRWFGASPVWGVVGTLDPPTQPGQAYRVTGWLRRSPNPASPEEKVAVLLEDAQGLSLAVITTTVRDTNAWSSFSATVVPSRQYRRLVLRSNNDPGARSTNGLVGVDDLGVFPIANPPLVLAAIPDVQLAPGAFFHVACRVTGVDAFDSSLRYSLAPGAPDGMFIDPQTGVLGWNVLSSQALSSWNVTVKVRVDANPDLATTAGFKVETSEAAVLKLATVAVAGGEQARIPIQFTPYLKLSNRLSRLTFTLVPGNGSLTQWNIEAVSPQVQSAQLTPAGDGRFTVTLDSAPGSGFSAAQTLAILTATTGAHSAVVPLEIPAGQALTTDHPLPLLPPRVEHVFIVGGNPFLWADTQSGQTRVLQVLGPPGTRVTLASATSLQTPVMWQPFQNVTLNGLMETINGIPAEPAAIFFRILK